MSRSGTKFVRVASKVVGPVFFKSPCQHSDSTFASFNLSSVRWKRPDTARRPGQGASDHFSINSPLRKALTIDQISFGLSVDLKAGMAEPNGAPPSAIVQ